MFDDLDLTKITGEHTREHVARLLNLIETLGADLRAAQAEIQRLRDEVNRLKGEQGKPSVKPGTKPPPRIIPQSNSGVSPDPGRKATRSSRYRLTGSRCYQ